MRRVIRNLRVTMDSDTPEGLAVKDFYTVGVQVIAGGGWAAIGRVNSEINAALLRDGYQRNGVSATVIPPMEFKVTNDR